LKKIYTYFFLFFIFGSLTAQVPGGTLTVSSGTVCTGRDLSFTLQTTGSPTVQWKLPYGANVYANPSFSVFVFRISNAGIKTFSVVLSNASGSVQLTSTHTVYSSARASFLAKAEHSAVPAQIQCTNYSTSYTQTVWYSDLNFSSPIVAFHAQITFTNAGTHTVTLVAEGTAGCNDTNQYVIRLFDKSSLRLPNVFTPNNDGVNDIYRPIMEGIKKIHVMIFNRWGLLIREWEQVNGFWDGYTSAGIPCQEGTYFVVCEAEGVDGQNYSLKSTVQLSR